MRTVKTWNKMTARQIIAAKDSCTNGGHNLTNGVAWQYRTDRNTDGTRADMGPCACDADRATCITIESVDGILAQLDI